MYVHKEAGLCFLAHPRTGSRAVRDALLKIGFEEGGSHHDGPDQGHDLSPYHTVFSVVRNHWDTMVSWWYNGRMHYKEQKPSLGWLSIHMSFNRYYFRPGRLFWFIDQVPDLVVVKYEDMESEINSILAFHDLPLVQFPKVGVSTDRGDRHYSTYYDRNTRAFVDWVFRPEIEELGYRFEEQDVRST